MRPGYTLVVIIIVATVLLVAFAVFSAQQLQPTEEPAEVPTATKPTFELGMYGKIVSLVEAEQLLAYKIKLPRYLPAGNELKMIKVDENTKWSFVIYSPENVSDSTSEEDLFKNNGFIIINSLAPEVTDVDAEIQRLVEFGGKEITMQNVKGVGLTDVPLLPGYSEIHWWDDKLHHLVGGNFEFAELAKIVESI
ncbi:MAG: hypothetical protein ACRD38_08805 [Nitrososphaerales archaeon]